MFVNSLKIHAGKIFKLQKVHKNIVLLSPYELSGNIQILWGNPNGISNIPAWCTGK